MHEVGMDAEMAGWLCDKRMLRVLNGCLLQATSLFVRLNMSLC